jgi:hypothetical protein
MDITDRFERFILGSSPKGDAMKVLKKGNPGQTGWSKEIECTGHGNGMGGCGAFLLVSVEDLYKTYSHCRDETDTFITFRCPECKFITDLKDPPSQLWGQVRSREIVND